MLDSRNDNLIYELPVSLSVNKVVGIISKWNGSSYYCTHSAHKNGLAKDPLFLCIPKAKQLRN